MANAKGVRTLNDIRIRIKSIQNTQKITRAMEMIAASKMRKALQRMNAARPYAAKIRSVVAHVAAAHAEYHHGYLIHRPLHRIGYIIVSTDRGLCAGLNVCLFREVLKSMREYQSDGIAIELCTIGKKARDFFRRFGGQIVAHADHLGDAPDPQALIGLVKVMLDGYAKGRIDRLYLAHNAFVNRMTQRPRLLQLIPALAEAEHPLSDPYWDYLYEPDSKELLDTLFDRYLIALVYHGVVENFACEMAARLLAMKNATDNADNLIDALRLDYQKARQAAITKELAEIVAGAAAV